VELEIFINCSHLLCICFQLDLKNKEKFNESCYDKRHINRNSKDSNSESERQRQRHQRNQKSINQFVSLSRVRLKGRPPLLAFGLAYATASNEFIQGVARPGFPVWRFKQKYTKS
jgi:hypothetical protein